jgi:transcriptional regulator with XRE-family HTH domain
MRRQKFSSVFGTVVRRRRQALGVSQEALAELAEIHPMHVGYIERGQRSPSIDVAEQLAWALGVPIAVLMAEAEQERGGRSPHERRTVPAKRRRRAG